MNDRITPRYLPYGCQQISEEDIEAVVNALRSPRITQGPLVEAFEHSLGDYLGATYTSVVSNGTAALHLAYTALDIGPGDEIITSPITFAATANAARYLGADVRFADVDPTSGNIDPASVATLIGPKTKAIVAVHLGGLPCNMQALRALATKHNLYLVEDAAHALGATYHGRRIGSGIADVATFSFHPVKHLTTGEGGAVTTNSRRIKDRVDRLRHHGVERQTNRFVGQSPGRWYYEINELGYNYRLTEFQCALGLSQLKRQAKRVERRQAIAKLYLELLSGVSGVTAQARYDDRQSAFHLFPVLIDFDALGVSRDTVMSQLDQQGIGTQVHYIPVDEQPYYRQRYGKPASRPGARQYYAQTLSLPMYPALTDSDIRHVAHSLMQVLEKQAPILQSTKVAS